jgi:hypothetical protein
MTTGALPGLSLTFVPRGSPEEPLRTDVAVFLGRTRRGPVGVPVRVESWNDVVGALGGPDGTSATPPALRGFFENGGRTAWVVRVCGPADTASAVWEVAGRSPARAGFTHERYRVEATSPGGWANDTRVAIRFRASTVAGPPTVDVRITAPGEPVEAFSELPAAEVAERLTASRLVRLVPLGEAAPGSPLTGAITARWDLVLGGGADSPPGAPEYAAAARAQADLPEPSLVCSPDLGTDVAGTQHVETVLDLLRVVRPLRDRLVLVDVPPTLSSVDEALRWLATLTASGDDALLREAAVYHPPLRSLDSRGATRPLLTVPSSGHVLGVVARLDAERGSHHTPANAVLQDAVDLAEEFPEPQQARLFEAGVNLLRCTRGRGLLVWGGRTLAPDRRHRFVAHRRLVHLLVRAIRRVAEPLVFDVNSPELRLTLVRALTSVLLAAFRSGALAGARPEQAFRVTCDETNNPVEQDPALVVCEVEVAPAAPMEFIRLRLVLGQDRGLEVTEA